MTGHSISAPQNQEFLSTMHTMIDDLDTITISSAIDEHIYLRLVNGLQRLYNIHNSTIQSPNSVRETWDHRQQGNNVAQNITSALVRHYERVNDISGIHIYPVNSDNVNSDNVNSNNVNSNNVNSDNVNSDNVNNDNVNSDAYPVNSNNVNSNNTNIYIVNSNANNEFNQELLRESASYRALYNAPYDYWNQPQDREFQVNVIAR